MEYQNDEEQTEKNKKEGFVSFSDIFINKKKIKAPAYPWQDLALRIIADLQIPNFKRSAVFKVCRDLPATYVERALNDTKELCASGIKWKYFFKIAENAQDSKKLK